MNPWEFEPHRRMSDRMPHSGWAAFGPYRDAHGDLAVVVACVASAIFLGLWSLLA